MTSYNLDDMSWSINSVVRRNFQIGHQIRLGWGFKGQRPTLPELHLLQYPFKPICAERASWMDSHIRTADCLQALRLFCLYFHSSPVSVSPVSAFTFPVKRVFMWHPVSALHSNYSTAAQTCLGLWRWRDLIILKQSTPAHADVCEVAELLY